MGSTYPYSNRRAATILMPKIRRAVQESGQSHHSGRQPVAKHDDGDWQQNACVSITALVATHDAAVMQQKVHMVQGMLSTLKRTLPSYVY